MANNTIALLARMPEFETGSERETKKIKLQALRDEAALAQQAMADDKAVREVYRTQTDPAARVKALYGVSPKAGMSAEKAAADLAKDQAETGQKVAATKASEIDTARKKVDAMGQMMGYVARNPTPEVAERAINALLSQGMLDEGQANEYRQRIAQDPNAIKQLAEEGYSASLDAKDQLAKIETRDLGDRVQTTSTDPVTGQQRVVNTSAKGVSPDSALSAATTRRGQDFQREASMRAEARERDQSDGARGVIIQTDDGPMLANPRTGNTKQIISPDGKPVTRTKPLTEFQGKSAAFGDRAMAADKIISEMNPDAYSPTAINLKTGLGGVPIVGSALEGVANKALSDNSQKIEQAQRDFINAVLRQESGAAIGKDEFENAKRQYFPQPGDSAAVIQQKAANRKLVIEGFKRSAGPNAQFTTPASPNAASADGWTVTEVK